MGLTTPPQKKLDVKKPEVCCWANHLHRVLKRYIETKVPSGTPDTVMAQTGTGKKKKPEAMSAGWRDIVKWSRPEMGRGTAEEEEGMLL
jgi:hypothetical protein